MAGEGWGHYLKQADDTIRDLKVQNRKLEQKILILNEVLTIIKALYDSYYEETKMNKISLEPLEPYLTGIIESCKLINSDNDNRCCEPENLKLVEEQLETGLEIIRMVRQFFTVSK